MSYPPIVILPSSGSQNPARSLPSVDLPPPEGPTNAIMLPSLILKETLSAAFFSDLPIQSSSSSYFDLPYEKLTFLNSMSLLLNSIFSPLLSSG